MRLVSLDPRHVSPPRSFRGHVYISYINLLLYCKSKSKINRKSWTKQMIFFLFSYLLFITLIRTVDSEPYRTDSHSESISQPAINTSGAAPAAQSILLSPLDLHSPDSTLKTSIKPADPETYRLESLPAIIFPTCWVFCSKHSCTVQPAISSRTLFLYHLSSHLQQTDWSGNLQHQDVQ